MKQQRGKRWLSALTCTAVLCMGTLLDRPAQAIASQAQAVVHCAANPQATMLVPVGKTVGIKLFSHGVMVIGLEDIQTADGAFSPARECGLKTGDIITELNNSHVNTIEEVQSILQSHEGEALHIIATRGAKNFSLTVQPAACLADGRYKLGAWIRDSMAGIGTVTWYDPQTKQFCALGHGINDVDTELLMPLKDGAIMPSRVTSVLAGTAGNAGQLHGTFDLNRDLGKLTANTSYGIFGQLYGEEFEGQAIPVAKADEVKTGAATILSCVNGEQVKEYSVEILRIYPCSSTDTRNLMIQVTDQALLSKTGGIVQGQSGSPILQNGKLVGAVTHVLVNDPTRGYGILVETMLSGEIAAK